MAKRALLIGINRYKLAGADLRGCVNDVKNMSAVLTKYYGFLPTDITLLTDFDATKKKIEAGITKLVKGAKAGDVLYLHYSGHGANVLDDNGDEKKEADGSAGRDEILCPTDMNWSTPLRDDWLRIQFNKVPKGVNLTVIMDCCHSGTNTRAMIAPDSKEPINRFLPNPKDIYELECHRKLTGALRHTRDLKRESRAVSDISVADMPEVLITGCRDNQTSADAYISGSYNGALTYHLVKTINAKKGKLSYRDLHSGTTQLLAKGQYEQVPQLEGRAENFDRGFLASHV